jgi:hypothetical protein
LGRRSVEAALRDRPRRRRRQLLRQPRCRRRKDRAFRNSIAKKFRRRRKCGAGILFFGSVNKFENPTFVPQSGANTAHPVKPSSWNRIICAAYWLRLEHAAEFSGIVLKAGKNGVEILAAEVIHDQLAEDGSEIGGEREITAFVQLIFV